MIVTDIQDMDKKRKKIFIDYEYAFFLYNSEIIRYGIVKDSELSSELYHEINEELVVKRVKARALYILKSAQKTRKQLTATQQQSTKLLITLSMYLLTIQK